MANHKAAIKKARQDQARRLRNRGHRSRMATAVKKFRKALAAGDVDTARSLLPGTLSLLDRSAKLGVVHGNAAARGKSRLTRALNKAAAGS